MSDISVTAGDLINKLKSSMITKLVERRVNYTRTISGNWLQVLEYYIRDSRPIESFPYLDNENPNEKIMYGPYMHPNYIFNVIEFKDNETVETFYIQVSNIIELANEFIAKFGDRVQNDEVFKTCYDSINQLREEAKNRI